MANSTPLHDLDQISTVASRPLRHRNPLIYWHLLSLDAPTVAMLWTWFIARCSGIKLPAESIVAMGIAVWMLYAADRLLDTRKLDRSSVELRTLEPRHHFHQDHSKAFRSALALASLALIYLVRDLARPSIRLYSILAVPLFAYFLLIHQTPDASSRPAPRLPKEIAVGVFFSAATFIPTIARAPDLRVLLLPSAILFGLLCSLNCLFIYAWEHPQAARPRYAEAHSITRFALRFLPLLTTLTIVGGLALALLGYRSLPAHPVSWQLATSIALAAALLQRLNAGRRSLDATTLRTAADLCLLTPVLFLFTLPS